MNLIFHLRQNEYERIFNHDDSRHHQRIEFFSHLQDASYLTITYGKVSRSGNVVLLEMNFLKNFVRPNRKVPKAN